MSNKTIATVWSEINEWLQFYKSYYRATDMLQFHCSCMDSDSHLSIAKRQVTGETGLFG